jgi:D-psicose/D-tagatose/L-ribulose 3-epimerase
MLFGICCAIDEEGNIKHIDYYKICGFDYLELPLNKIASMNDVEFRKMYERIEKTGLPVLSANCFMDSRIKITGPEFNNEIFTEYVKKVLLRAHNLGIQKTVFGSGTSRNIPAGFSRDKAMKQLSENLSYITDEAADYGMTVEVEHLNKGESNVLCTYEETRRFVKEADIKNLKINLDWYHFSLGNENLTELYTDENLIGHVHFANTLGRVFPVINELGDSMSFFRTLLNTGYDDTFSFECSIPGEENEPKKYMESLQEIKRIFNNREKYSEK